MNISSSNGTSDSCMQGPPDSPTIGNVKTTFLCIIGGFGVLGNIFIIIAALKCTTRRRLHYLIINMAVADTLVVLTTLFYVIIWHLDYNIYQNTPEILAEILCKTIPSINDISHCASSLTLVVISIERYRTTIVRTIKRPKRPVYALVLPWLIPSLLVVDSFYNLKVINGQCSNRTEYRHYVSIVFNLTFITQSLVIVILSIITLKRLSKPSGIENSLSEPQRTIRARRMKKVVYMVLFSFLLFCCCYFPFTVMVLMYRITILASICVERSTVMFVVSLLPLFNATLSPCIYLVFLNDIRNSLAKCLLFRRPKIFAAFKRKSVELVGFERHRKEQVLQNN